MSSNEGDDEMKVADEEAGNENKAKDTTPTLQDICLSLPPMESRDFNIAKQDLAALHKLETAKSDDAMSLDDVIQARMKRTCQDEETVKEPTTKLGLDVYNQLKEYIKKFEQKGLTARFSVEDNEERGTKHELLARTYVEHIDGPNCNSGSYSTEWKIRQHENTLLVELYGKANIQCYYYEDGNVQLRANREFPTLTHAGEDVAGKIAEYEKRLHKDLMNLYGEDCDLEKSLKRIRRVLPITRTRMKWDSAAQRNVRTLQTNLPNSSQHSAHGKETSEE